MGRAVSHTTVVAFAFYILVLHSTFLRLFTNLCDIFDSSEAVRLFCFLVSNETPGYSRREGGTAHLNAKATVKFAQHSCVLVLVWSNTPRFSIAGLLLALSQLVDWFTRRLLTSLSFVGSISTFFCLNFSRSSGTRRNLVRPDFFLNFFIWFFSFSFRLEFSGFNFYTFACLAFGTWKLVHLSLIYILKNITRKFRLLETKERGDELRLSLACGTSTQSRWNWIVESTAGSIGIQFCFDIYLFPSLPAIFFFGWKCISYSPLTICITANSHTRSNRTCRTFTFATDTGRHVFSISSTADRVGELRCCARFVTSARKTSIEEQQAIRWRIDHVSKMGSHDDGRDWSSRSM